MPSDRGNNRRNQRNEEDPAFRQVPNPEGIDPKEEFKVYEPHPDFWGVQAERFRRGLTKNPIITEQPKNTTNLSKLIQESAHYFEIEDASKRSIVCTTCEIKHGGILEARNLTSYKLEDGVLYFRGQAINKTP